MRILVSAYACNPYLGSEPGVGWASVCRIAREHEVFALVHVRHQIDWEKARLAQRVPPNIHVRFLGRLRPWHSNRFVAHLQSWRSFRAYNREVLEAARSWHREAEFEVCHQVTIATWRVPSPLWRLGIPFIWGPIGGAGYIPKEFRAMLSTQARLFEKLRDWNSWHALRSREFQACVKNASTIFAANDETIKLLGRYRGNRPLVWLPIASISDEKAEAFAPRNLDCGSGDELRLFAGGNMEGRKGVSLALRALARAKQVGLRFRYTVAGGGPEVPGLTRLAERLGLSSEVDFHPGFRGEEYTTALQESDVYFLPSFRESTPVTLLEAYLAGCHPLVADTGAQGEIVKTVGGTVVPIDSMDGLIEGLASALTELAARRRSLREEVLGWSPRLRMLFDAQRYDQALESAYYNAKNPPS